MAQTPERMLNLREVSRITGKSQQQLRRLCRDGKLAATKLGQGHWMIDEVQLAKQLTSKEAN